MRTATPTLTLDAEFAELLVPHAPEEEALLRRSLIDEGCREPIAVWAQQGVVLDGHARLRLCRELGVSYRVQFVELRDREDARRFVVERQLARRNLGGLARSYYRGSVYRAAAKRPGARTPGQIARRWAADQAAAVFQVDESTVRRDARLARDIDRLAEMFGVEYRADLLAGRARLTRGDIARLARMDRIAAEEGRQRIEDARGPSVRRPTTADRAADDATPAAPTEGSAARSTAPPLPTAEPITAEGVLAGLCDLWEAADGQTRREFLGLPSIAALVGRMQNGDGE